MDDLVVTFEASLASAVPGERRAPVRAFLAEAFEVGRGAWPKLELEPNTFVAALARHARATPEKEPILVLQHAADYFLAVACAVPVPGSVDALHQHVLVDVPRWIGSRAEGAADDVRQLVAMRLLVADGDALPRIAEYTGKGPLGAFVRVVATRVALNLQRRREPRDDLALIPLGASPDVDLSRFRYRAEFRSAFESALVGLSADERLLLRLHAVERMRGEDIARLLEVDRSTVMRRVARARERLFDGTKSAMMASLRLSTQEFESVARDVQSAVDLTLSRILA